MKRIRGISDNKRAKKTMINVQNERLIIILRQQGCKRTLYNQSAKRMYFQQRIYFLTTLEIGTNSICGLPSNMVRKACV